MIADANWRHYDGLLIDFWVNLAQKSDLDEKVKSKTLEQLQ